MRTISAIAGTAIFDSGGLGITRCNGESPNYLYWRDIDDFDARQYVFVIPADPWFDVVLTIVSAFLSPGLTTCGGGSSSTTPTPIPTPPVSGGVTVSVSPHLSAVTTSQSQPFTATLSGR